MLAEEPEEAVVPAMVTMEIAEAPLADVVLFHHHPDAVFPLAVHGTADLAGVRLVRDEASARG